MQHCLLNINVFGYKQRTAALCWICSWRSGFAFTEIFFLLDQLKEYSVSVAAAEWFGLLRMD